MEESRSLSGWRRTVHIEIDNISGRASGGVEETVFNARSDGPRTNQAKLWTGATATAGYGINLDSWGLPQDVGPAVADDWNWHQRVWGPMKDLGFPIMLKGPACMKIFTYAATTAPSWLWSIAWAEIDESELP